MPRLTELDDLLFPVEEHPVFVSYSDESGEKRLQVPEKKAIVNRTTRRVLGVVSRDYRLVSNREALQMAHECCHAVFPETRPGDWQVSAVDAPSTAASCHIDLVHASAALDFAFGPIAGQPQPFGPFIRVTNSYNGLRALKFDVGFFRKVCTNGLIVPDTIIRFTFAHLRREIGDVVEFHVAVDRLAKFRAGFIDSLAALRDCRVPRYQVEPLIRRVLMLWPPQTMKPGSPEAVDWQVLHDHLAEISSRYVTELGENAYAAFNAITEFASHPPDIRCVRRNRHSLQRLAGSWLTSFNEASRKPGFTVIGHLAQLEAERAKAQSN